MRHAHHVPEALAFNYFAFGEGSPLAVFLEILRKAGVLKA